MTGTSKIPARKEEPTANGKTLKDIAKEVIKGKWGNGKKRIKKLRSAGYSDGDIAVIQDKVNNLAYKAIAKQIIKGKWGNGQERIDRLKGEGYGDAEITIIQEKVNKILEG